MPYWTQSKNNNYKGGDKGNKGGNNYYKGGFGADIAKGKGKDGKSKGKVGKGKSKGKGKDGKGKGGYNKGKGTNSWNNQWANVDKAGKEICRNFHLSTCANPNCQRAHKCPKQDNGWICLGTHRAEDCPAM